MTRSLLFRILTDHGKRSAADLMALDGILPASRGDNERLQGHRMSGRKRSHTQRQRLAYEAARIMVDQGIRGFDRARRKAAERAGISDKRLWPKNGEIQEALLQQQRLFQGTERKSELTNLRRQALAAMDAFADFAPRLVGPVLSGSADHIQGVRLHLFTDNPEDVVFTLLDRGIPWQESEKVLCYAGDLRCTHPVFAFFAGDTAFELVVLPIRVQRNPPLDTVNQRPERGAGAAEVAHLLDDIF